MSDGAKFTGTSQGHVHSYHPRVFVSAEKPTEGMKRGDIWIYAANPSQFERMVPERLGDALIQPRRVPPANAGDE